jgi:N-acetylglutamate synthase-like GNAT family acetyltransferase
MVDEAKRILKRTGKVLLIDHTNNFSGMGTSSDFILTEKSAQELFEKRGFVFDKKAPADMFHFGMIFKL